MSVWMSPFPFFPDMASPFPSGIRLFRQSSHFDDGIFEFSLELIGDLAVCSEKLIRDKFFSPLSKYGRNRLVSFLLVEVERGFDAALPGSPRITT